MKGCHQPDIEAPEEVLALDKGRCPDPRAVLAEIGNLDHQTKIEMPVVEAENHLPLALGEQRKYADLVLGAMARTPTRP